MLKVSKQTLHSALYRSINILLKFSCVVTLQGFLVCYCECGSPSVPVTAVSWMLSVLPRHCTLRCTDPYIVCWLGLFRYTAEIFIVLRRMWQSVCSSYCRQVNTVIFKIDTSFCTLQIHIHPADLIPFGYTAGIFSTSVWIWRYICSNYCSQQNAVSFNTDISCRTV